MKERFFKNPNKENSYWAGFISGDGCIKPAKDGRKSKLEFYLSSKDDLHLKRFSERLGLNRNTNKGSISRLSISSNILVKDLENNFNITKKKTFTIKPPNILGRELIKSYIVGIIDADGWITRRKKTNVLTFGICSASKDLIIWLKENIETICKIHSKRKINKRDNTYSIYYSHKQAEKILSVLNKVNVPKLERKWSKIDAK